jgi:hypothetical protein
MEALNWTITASPQEAPAAPRYLDALCRYDV